MPKRHNQLLLAAAVLLSLPIASMAQDDRREQAVRWARAGDTGRALDALRAQYAAGPSAVLLYDLLVVAHWHGDDALAAELVQKLDPHAAPLYAVEAAATALRNQKRFAEAHRLFSICVERWPEARDCRLSTALTRAEQGEHAAALASLTAMARDEPASASLQAALGYVYRLSRDWGNAAASYQAAAARAPERDDYLRLAVLSLLDLGAPYRAQALVADRSEVLTEADRARLRADLAARAVRFGNLPADTARERFDRADAALGVLAANGRHDATDTLQRRTRLDRLVALRQREMMSEVLQEYAVLEAEGALLPPYALNAVGDAYLAERQPQRAIPLYTRSLEQAPDQPETRIALAFAYAEAERFEEAFVTIDALVVALPAFAADRAPNFDKAYAEVVAGLLRGYADMHPQAMARLEALAQQAPVSPDVRATLATVYRWRGWPRRAQEEYRIALSLDPSHLDARLGAASTALDLDDVARAESIVESLSADFPDNRQVERVRQDLQRAQGWHFSSDATSARSSDGIIASEEYAVYSRLDSPLLTPRLRAYAWQYYTQGEVPAGSVDTSVFGAGLDYRIHSLNLYGGLHVTPAEDGTGATVGTVWQRDDHWSWSAEAATEAVDVPLAAREAGIDADMLQLGMSYRWDETRRLELSARALDFSDGNRRHSLGAELEQRLYTAPHLQLNGTLGLYASENSRAETAYFNPAADFSASAGATAQWVTWRHYDRAFLQRLRVAVGGYRQEAFGTEAIYGVGYEHEWRLGDDLRLRYGVDWGSNVYDGERESRAAVSGGISWSFGS